MFMESLMGEISLLRACVDMWTVPRPE